MLSPKYMKNLPHGLKKYYQGLEDDILRDVIRRVKKAGTLTETGNIQIESLLNLGYDLKEVKKEIVKNVDITANKFGRIVKKARLDSYQNDIKYYLKGGKKLDNIAQVKNIITGITNNSVSDFKNITGTLGLAGKPLEQFYKDKLNQAFINISSGAFSSDQMIRKTINELGDAGLQVINYKSGRNFSLEAAVKMNLNSTVNRLSAEISLQNARDMNQDLMEITAHEGARPTHQDWQGQIVSLSGNSKYLSLNDIGYGQADGFMGVNCRHNWYPFFEGLSEKYWMKERLKELNPEPFEYEGKVYDLYKANQRVRAIERSIRKSKRKIAMYDEVGDEEGKLNETIKLQRKKQEQNKFNEAMYKNDKVRYNKIEEVINNNYQYLKDGIKEAIENFSKVTNIEFRTIALQEYRYIGTWRSFDMNYYLRTGDTSKFRGSIEEHLNTIDTLKKVIMKNKTHKDFISDRYVDENWLKYFISDLNISDTLDFENIVKELNKNIGYTQKQLGFISTSVEPKNNFFKDRPIKLEIYSPKGTHCYATHNIDESEIIFNSGVKFNLQEAIYNEKEDSIILKILLEE